MKNIVVLVSGNGSNLQAIIDAIKNKEINANISLVVSSKKEAYALRRAWKEGIKTFYLPFSADYTTRYRHNANLADEISLYKPDLIVLAGWMHILSKEFLLRFPNKVINLHPALPGQFPGKTPILDAYEAFRRKMITHTGVMVHRAIPEIDAGPVIEEQQVSIFSQDSFSALEKRIHNAEHKILVKAIKKVLQC